MRTGDEATLSENFHLSDEEMLLAADGELPTRRAAQVRAHLAACWHCRARMGEVEAKIADFARAYRQTLDPELPPIDGPRALLRAQLAVLAAQPRPYSWRRFFPFHSAPRTAAFLCATFLVAIVIGKLLVQRSARNAADSAGISFDRVLVPDPSLTPGATRQVSVSDVCSMVHEEVIRDVPSSLRQEIFREYGITGARAKDYEIDYLITPGLGGAEDIRNLWPEPYASPTWNAHVKDALEEHLHQLVCAGKLDLPSAQLDISTDWIAAYKKYFHTNRPLSLHSGLTHFGDNPKPALDRVAQRDRVRSVIRSSS